MTKGIMAFLHFLFLNTLASGKYPSFIQKNSDKKHKNVCQHTQCERDPVVSLSHRSRMRLSLRFCKPKMQLSHSASQMIRMFWWCSTHVHTLFMIYGTKNRRSKRNKYAPKLWFPAVSPLFPPFFLCCTRVFHFVISVIGVYFIITAKEHGVLYGSPRPRQNPFQHLWPIFFLKKSPYPPQNGQNSANNLPGPDSLGAHFPQSKHLVDEANSPRICPE